MAGQQGLVSKRGKGQAARSRSASGPGDHSASYRLVLSIFEGVAILVLLLGVERLFFGAGAFASLNPHPFWLAVLLVSVQHGLYGGVCTAALAALMFDWPARAPGLDIAAYYLEVARQPVQWLLTALLIGIYRQAQLREQAARISEVAHLREVNEQIAEEVARLDDELWQFEIERVVDRAVDAHSCAGVVRAAPAPGLARLAALRAASPSEIGSRFAAGTTALLGAAEARLFRSEGSRGFVDITPGQAIPALGRSLPRDHALVRAAAAAEHAAICRASADALLVVPLRPDGGRVIGMIAAVPPGGSPGSADPAWAEGLRWLADAAAMALQGAEENGTGLPEPRRGGHAH